MCSNTFTCLTEISIVGHRFEGYHWFFSMLFVAFWLQISANFIWLKTSQLSREILRMAVGGGMRNDLIRWSNFWTGMSTLVWILRIVLVIGNNVWIFIVILLGNITGNHWALSVQAADQAVVSQPLAAAGRVKKLEKNKKLVL